MPLVLAHIWHVDKQILTRLVLERGLLDLQLDDARRMLNRLDQSRLLSTSVGTDPAFQNIEHITDQQEPITPVSTAMSQLVLDNATDTMKHQGSQEHKGQMMGVPKGLERLVPLGLFSGRVHQDHAQQHDMARHTRGGLVQQLGRRHGKVGIMDNAILIIHLEKVDIMADGMDRGADQNGVGRNLVEPDSFIHGDQLVQERDAKDAEDVPADGEQDDGAIPDETDTASTSDPERITQGDVEIVE